MYKLTVLIFGLLAIVQIANRLVFSLICKTDSKLGGFGIANEGVTSFIQTLAGVYVLIIPWALTTSLNKKYGIIGSLKIVSITIIPLLLFMPILKAIPDYFQNFALGTIYGLINSFVIMFIFYISICVTNTVSSDIMGTANGISQSFVALVRFASYASFGLIYG